MEEHLGRLLEVYNDLVQSDEGEPHRGELFQAKRIVAVMEIRGS